MKGTPKPTRPIEEVMEESRNNFKRIYGHLLTQNEAVEITEKIKQKLKEEAENR